MEPGAAAREFGVDCAGHSQSAASGIGGQRSSARAGDGDAVVKQPIPFLYISSSPGHTAAAGVSLLKLSDEL